MNPKGVFMKNKLFFVAGFAVSAIAASCFIPLADGNYWWSTWSEPHVTVAELPERMPAGGNDGGTPIDAGGADPTLPETPYEEPPVEYQDGGKDAPAAPPAPAPYPEPAPYVPPTYGNCLQRAFGGEAAGGINFSSAYINSYLRAAVNAPYNLGVDGGKCGNNCKRLAIMGILSAGYCNPTSRYQNAYQSSTVLPRLTRSWTNYNLTERTREWRRNHKDNTLYCANDAFDSGASGKRIRICENVYAICGITRNYAQRDCRGLTDDDDDDGGGNSTGGNTNGGQLEVGRGTNEGSGHGVPTGGGDTGAQSSGPPGSVEQ
jgi:hypothetical protein